MDQESNLSTLRLYGIMRFQTYAELSKANSLVFRLQPESNGGNTTLTPVGLVASAYSQVSTSKDELLSAQSQMINENPDQYRRQVTEHVGMWALRPRPSSTHFVSASFNLAWIFWEAERRYQRGYAHKENNKLLLIVMKSAALRYAGVLSHSDIDHLQRDPDLQTLQNYASCWQEVIVPVFVPSEAFITTVPLGIVWPCLPSWIPWIDAVPSHQAHPHPLESSPPDNGDGLLRSSEESDGPLLTNRLASGPSSGDDGRLRRWPSGDEPSSFADFCHDCASLYAMVDDKCKETQALALSLAILCGQDHVNSEIHSALEPELAERVANLAIDIWRWPTRMEDWKTYGRTWLKWCKEQAALDWPGKGERVLLSLTEPLDQSPYVSTSEDSSMDPAPIGLTGECSEGVIERDSCDSIPEQQDEQHNASSVGPILTEVKDEDKEMDEDKGKEMDEDEDEDEPLI